MIELESWSKQAYVSRVHADEKEVEYQSAVFGRHLAEQLTDVYKGLDRTNFSLAGARSAELSESDRAKYMDSWAQSKLSEPMMPLLLTLDSGNRVIGPPYDTEWSEGSGLVSAWTVKDNGKCFTMSTEGFSASGIGIFLNAPRPLDVAVTPLGTHDFNWFSISHDPNLRSKGGLGVAVYEVGNDVPIRQSRATLWNVVGAVAWTGGDGGGHIGEAITGTTSFGHIRLSPTIFSMRPGKRYLFWVWLWQTFVAGEASGFMCMHRAEIRAISTSAGPPLVIH